MWIPRIVSNPSKTYDSVMSKTFYVLLISLRAIEDYLRNSQHVLFASFRAYENLSHNVLFYDQPRNGSHIQLISILTKYLYWVTSRMFYFMMTPYRFTHWSSWLKSMIQLIYIWNWLESVENQYDITMTSLWRHER